MTTPHLSTPTGVPWRVTWRRCYDRHDRVRITASGHEAQRLKTLLEAHRHPQSQPLLWVLLEEWLDYGFWDREMWTYDLDDEDAA